MHARAQPRGARGLDRELLGGVERLERAAAEAGLARELGIPYAGVCMVVNPAAGRGPAVLEVDDMYTAVAEAQPRLLRLLNEFLRRG